jgi:hypothetical protein
MDRDHALAAVDEIEQRLFLIGRERGVVAVEDQPVIVLKAIGAASDWKTAAAGCGVPASSWPRKRILSGVPVEPVPPARPCCPASTAADTRVSRVAASITVDTRGDIVASHSVAAMPAAIASVLPDPRDEAIAGPA